jgi:TolB-like protein/Flp pilus assembly protein TadD
MSAETEPPLQVEIAHVLFIDVVGYSKLLMDDQRELQARLKEVVRSSNQFRDAEAAGKLVRLPTGDGMALVFFSSLQAPIECALEISRAAKKYPQLQLRMGVNTGPVSVTTDVNEQPNIAGTAINLAKRVMDYGDAGHILLSEHAAEDLASYRRWHPHLKPLGQSVTKHGEPISLVNFCMDDVGNPQIPERLKHDKHRTGTKFGSKRKKALLVAGLVVVAAISSFVLFCAPAKKIDKSIAVLPFENLSDEKENDYFAGGLQDDLLTNLAKIGDLKVISRTSVRQYKDTPRNVRDIGKALGVATVLEGSVRRSGSRVRLNVQLINASNDQHIWAEDYDRDLTDVFAIQSDLALQIASTLQTKLSPTEKTRLQQRPTQSGEAYLIYLQAQNVNGFQEAIQLYEKAIALDPSFALAFARLSFVASTDYFTTGNPASLEKARAAANEALRLQPGLPEAHLALGHVYYRGDRDYDRALQELAIAKEGLPNDAEIFLVIGSIERRRGNWAQSTTDLEKAASLNPKDGSLWANLAENYRALNNFSAAEHALDRGIALVPDFFLNRYLRASLDIDSKGDIGAMERMLAQFPGAVDPDGRVTFARFQLKLFQRKYKEALEDVAHSALESLSPWKPPTPIPKTLLVAMAYRLLGEDQEASDFYEKAKDILEQAVQENPLDPSRHVLLGQSYAGLGRKDDAIREGKRAVALRPESQDALDGVRMTLGLAQIYAMLGEQDMAIPLLEHCVALPAGVSSNVLKLDPAWDPLRDHPRFQKMIAQSLIPDSIQKTSTPNRK